MNLEFKKFELKNIQAPNFLMSPLELREYIDFEVKRVYFMSNLTGPTGEHCHLVEKELFVMIQGSATAVIDHGNGKKDVLLEGPKTAVYVGSYVWHHFKEFSNNAIILALSSTNYNPSRTDYIEDYDIYRDKIKDNIL